MHLFLKTDNFLEETGQFLEDFLQTNNADDPHSMCQKQSLSTTSIMDRQLLRQKISVIKTNTCVFVVFKTKRELKFQNELCIFEISFLWKHQSLYVLITEII